MYSYIIVVVVAVKVNLCYKKTLWKVAVSYRRQWPALSRLLLYSVPGLLLTSLPLPVTWHNPTTLALRHNRPPDRTHCQLLIFHCCYYGWTKINWQLWYVMSIKCFLRLGDLNINDYFTLRASSTTPVHDYKLLGWLFDRVDLIKPVSNVRPWIRPSVRTSVRVYKKILRF